MEWLVLLLFIFFSTGAHSELNPITLTLNCSGNVDNIFLSNREACLKENRAQISEDTKPSECIGVCTKERYELLMEYYFVDVFGDADFDHRIDLSRPGCCRNGLLLPLPPARLGPPANGISSI